MNNDFAELDNKVPILSGDQCAYWDAPIKLAVAKKHFPEFTIRQHIHDIDTLGAPKAAFREHMLLLQEEYAIAREAWSAKWTSGLIMVPSPGEIISGKEEFVGLVSANPQEILASLNFGDIDVVQKILSSRGVLPEGIVETAKSFFLTSRKILLAWLRVLSCKTIDIKSSFEYCRQKRESFLDIAINWNDAWTDVYNHCSDKAHIRPISKRKKELPFFFIVNEEGRLVRRDVYRQNGEWLVYKRNRPRPINIEEVVAVAPKAMLLGAILRSEGYLLIPDVGSQYLQHISPISETLELVQYPVIRIGLKWKEHTRPFINWIYETNGVAGLEKAVAEAGIRIES